ncbi:MAG: type II toxin-antitoxin system MqsR family toxin [candidate division Zixibacteria bacterium]|nr:type II toxin-antitoxin system MqsR family toxin [candidate division Zixibacteria bacterium]MCK4656692.1 type II toxin-antitoxin system MqsR family toxin [candidate division Zixibacteria bacterium]
MDEVASRDQIEKFLAKVVDCVEKGQFYYVNRSANLRTAAELEISQVVVVDVVQNLTYKDYYRGPRSDPERSYESVCEFGTTIDETEVYIKLALVERYKHMICNCISFHIPERPIEYPLKNGE